MATLGTLLAPDLIQTGSSWQLCADVNGYSRSDGASLTTQACRGRRFRILERQPKRIAVQLLEDGYRCWLELEAVLGRAERCAAWRPSPLSATEIEPRLPGVLAWSEIAQQRPNVYLWGGTTEPDMDCSGLMQMAFASQGIWIPRDAYQQERFCQPVAALPDDHSLLRPGDLLFFGTRQRCTHVGLTSAMAATATAQARTMGAMGSASTACTAAINTQWLAITGLNSAAQAVWCAAMTDRISPDAVSRIDRAPA